MAGINKVILVGNAGRDPESRTMPDGNAVVNFSLATSESWKDKNTGEKREQTEWHRCVAFRRLAEIIQQYVRKGSKLYIEGKLKTRKWQADDGSDRYATEIIVDQMQMLDSRGGGEHKPSQHEEQKRNGYQEQEPQQEGFDDDIPF